MSVPTPSVAITGVLTKLITAISKDLTFDASEFIHTDFNGSEPISDLILANTDMSSPNASAAANALGVPTASYAPAQLLFDRKVALEVLVATIMGIKTGYPTTDLNIDQQIEALKTLINIVRPKELVTVLDIIHAALKGEFISIKEGGAFNEWAVLDLLLLALNKIIETDGKELHERKELMDTISSIFTDCFLNWHLNNNAVAVLEKFESLPFSLNSKKIIFEAIINRLITNLQAKEDSGLIKNCSAISLLVIIEAKPDILMCSPLNEQIIRALVGYALGEGKSVNDSNLLKTLSFISLKLKFPKNILKIMIEMIFNRLPAIFSGHDNRELLDCLIILSQEDSSKNMVKEGLLRLLKSCELLHRGHDLIDALYKLGLSKPMMLAMKGEIDTAISGKDFTSRFQGYNNDAHAQYLEQTSSADKPSDKAANDKKGAAEKTAAEKKDTEDKASTETQKLMDVALDTKAEEEARRNAARDLYSNLLIGRLGRSDQLKKFADALIAQLPLESNLNIKMKLIFLLRLIPLELAQYKTCAKLFISRLTTSSEDRLVKSVTCSFFESKSVVSEEEAFEFTLQLLESHIVPCPRGMNEPEDKEWIRSIVDRLPIQPKHYNRFLQVIIKLLKANWNFIDHIIEEKIRPLQPTEQKLIDEPVMIEVVNQLLDKQTHYFSGSTLTVLSYLPIPAACVNKLKQKISSVLVNSRESLEEALREPSKLVDAKEYSETTKQSEKRHGIKEQTLLALQIFCKCPLDSSETEVAISTITLMLSGPARGALKLCALKVLATLQNLPLLPVISSAAARPDQENASASAAGTVSAASGGSSAALDRKAGDEPVQTRAAMMMHSGIVIVPGTSNDLQVVWTKLVPALRAKQQAAKERRPGTDKKQEKDRSGAAAAAAAGSAVSGPASAATGAVPLAGDPMVTAFRAAAAAPQRPLSGPSASSTAAAADPNPASKGPVSGNSI